MKRLLVVLMVLGLASMAYATDLHNTRQLAPKSNIHVGSNPGTPDGREGGETIETAVVIPGLPYTDTGNTCDNIDDYEEVCPYSSTSPDVVYAFTSPSDQLVSMDLCLSTYDTKIFVYDSGMGLVGCNDDFYFGDPPECGVFTSFLQVMMMAGATYYIVVDGYGGDCGDYYLTVTGEPIPSVTCYPDAVPEGEPPLGPGYVDNYNGGCNTPPTYPFQTYDWINSTDPDGCGWLCGVSGWYDGTTRDTDWFTATASGYEVSMTCEAAFETYIFFLGPLDCGTTGVLAQATCPPMVPTTLTFATTPGEEVWMWVGPTIFEGPQISYNYSLRVCGIDYLVVPTESATWGVVKSLYK